MKRTSINVEVLFISIKLAKKGFIFIGMQQFNWLTCIIDVAVGKNINDLIGDKHMIGRVDIVEEGLIYLQDIKLWIYKVLSMGTKFIKEKSLMESDSNYTEHREATLGSQNQETPELSRIIKSYGDSILRVSYSYLRSMSDAEDILQDTLIQLLRYKPAFVSTEHEKAWLLKVAINLSKNRLKSAWFKKTQPLTKEEFPEPLSEELSYVWEAVSQLPIQYREVIHLFYEEDYTTAEISKLLEKKEVTVRSMLYRARKRLKEILKEDYDFED